MTVDTGSGTGTGAQKVHVIVPNQRLPYLQNNPGRSQVEAVANDLPFVPAHCGPCRFQSPRDYNGQTGRAVR